MRFTYRCTDSEGQAQRGLLEARSTEAARAELSRRGWTIDTLTKLGRASPEAEEEAQPEPEPEPQPQPEPQPTSPLPSPDQIALSRADLLLLSTQLAALLTSGVAFERSLSALSEGDGPPAMASATLHKLIVAGHSLSEAMGTMPRAFPPLYVSMVRVGEHSGSLREVLLRLSEELRRTEQQRSRLRAALAYPVFIGLVSLAMIGFIFSFMLPRLLDVVAGLGGETPWLTRALMVLVEPRVALTAGALVCLLVLAWLASSQTPAGRLQNQTLLYSFPRLGSIFFAGLMGRVARQLAMMLRTGLHLDEALHVLVTGSTGYYLLDEALAEVADDIKTGHELEAPLQRIDLFPPLLVQLVSSGAAVGKLERFLEYYADLMEQQVELAVESLLALLEPLSIGLLGLFVGTVVLATFLPVYQVVTNF